MRALFSAFRSGPDRPVLADPEAIDREFRRHRLRIMLAITVGYAIAYTCRLALSVVKKPLLDEGIFTAAELGLIGSGLFYAYALGKLVNGFLADHANLRYFFALGVLGSALLNLGMAFSTTVALSVVLWSLNGWFQGFGAPAGVVALAQWFTAAERGRRYGIWSTAHSLGEGLTFVGVAGLVTLFGWRAGFWGPGVVCIAVAGALVVLMRDRPETLGLPSVAEWLAGGRGSAAAALAPAPAAASTWSEQRRIFRRPAIWVLALASAMIYVTRYAVNSWGVLFLQEERGLSLMEAGSVISVNTLAGIFGAVAYGFLSDKLFGGRRPPANLLFSLLELAGLTMIFFVPSSSTTFLTAGFLVFGFGLTGLVTSLGGLFAVDIVSRRAAGAVMGLVGVFSYFAAAIQENVSGVLIDRGTTLIDGVRHYDFSAPIAFWFGCSVVSALLSASLWGVRASNGSQQAPTERK